MSHVPCPMSKSGEDLSKLYNLTLSSELDFKVTLTCLKAKVQYALFIVEDTWEIYLSLNIINKWVLMESDYLPFW